MKDISQVLSMEGRLYSDYLLTRDEEASELRRQIEVTVSGFMFQISEGVRLATYSSKKRRIKMKAHETQYICSHHTLNLRGEIPSWKSDRIFQ